MTSRRPPSKTEIVYVPPTDHPGPGRWWWLSFCDRARPKGSAPVGAPVLKLTAAQQSDLLHCVATYHRTVGTPDYRVGRAVALKTGHTLRRLGLVVQANPSTPNLYPRWLPTGLGRVVAARLATPETVQ